MRSATRRRVPRSRPFVALIVLTAWFGSLLVAAPLQNAAAAVVADPTFTSPPTRGSTLTPSFDLAPNAAGDPIECQWLAGAATTAPTSGWADCSSPYVPTLADADGPYTIWARSRNTTTAPDPTAPPATPTATITTVEYSPGVSTTYTLDRIGPTLAVVSGPAGSSTGGSKTVTWVVSATDTGSPSGPVTCTLALGSTTFATGLCGAADAFPGSPLGADGSYALTATSTDADGNTTVSGTLATYTLDTSGPALTLASGPTGPGKNASPTWSVTAANNAVVSCDLFLTPRSATPTATTSNCSSFSPGALTDGTYELEASASDGSGNTRTQVMTTYALDTVVPVISVSPANTSSTSPAAGWTVTPSEGLTPTCSLTNGPTSYGDGTTGCGQFTSFTLTDQGTYTLTASITDAAGNTGTATGTWLYRSTPVVSVSTAKATGNSTSVVWSITAPSTANLACTIRGGTQASTPVTCAPGSVTTIVTGGEATYTFTATATDPGTGAVGTGSATYLLDTTPLPAFTVSGTSGDTINPAVSWTWSSAGAATSSCQLMLGSTTSGSPISPCSAYAGTLPSDGAWTLLVTLYDAAGNATTATSPEVRLDRGVPDAPGVSTTTYLAKDRAPAWTLTGEAGATFRCSWSTDVVPAPSGLPATGACTSSYAPTLPNVSGTYTLAVTQADAAGNTSLPTRKDYVLDVTPPVVSFTASPSSPVNTVVGAGTWTTTGEAGATSSCTLVQTTSAGSTTVYAGQSCTRTIAPTDNGEGSYVLTVVDTDAVGNQGTSISSTPFVIDRTDPGAPSITASPVSPSQALTASWTVAANDPSGKDLICRFVPNGDLTGAWNVCGPTVTWSPLPGEGSYVLQVRARDAAGNLSVIVASTPYVVDRTAPAAAVFTSAAATNFVTSATWTWTGEAGATAECQLQYNGLPPPGESLVYHPCASPQTESLTRGDGSYTLLVRLTDAALNTNTAVTSPIYDLDTSRPDPPVVSGPSGPSKQTTVSWTYTTTETRTPSLYCQLARSATATGTATIVEALAPCTSLTRTLPTLTADGYYVFSLQLQDRAGNLSPLGSSNPYLLDTTPPAPPVFTQQPSGTANVQSVVWAFTRDADATAECQVLRNGSPVTTWAACGTPHGETLTAGDGAYVLQVRLTDPVGNTGALVNSVTYTLDRTPPGAPTVTGPGGTSNKTTADYAISSTVEPGATAECRLTFEATPGAWTSCALPKTYALGADGTYFLQVRLTDQYGNLGLPGQSPTYLLDTKAPAAPVVTAPPSPAKVSTPVFSFTSDSDVTNVCSLARGGVVVATADGCRGSYAANLTGLADGDYVLTVRSTDAAGNATSGTSGAYTYDTTAPIPPSVTGPKGPSQNRTPVFTWTGETGARPECSLQVEGRTAGGFVACAVPYQPTLNADGTWVLTVRLTDAAGNVSDLGSSGGYLLDTTAPAAPVVVAPASPGRDLAPSWSAAVESGAFTECRLIGPSGIAAAFAPCSLPMTTPVGSDGTYTLEVRATDAAGNVSAVGSGTYVLDTVPPGAPIVADPTSPGRSRTPAVTFTTESGTTTTCRLSKATTVIAPSAPCTSPATMDVTGQPDGAYTLSIRAVDAAGNVGPAGTATYVLDTTAPAAPIMTLIAGSPSSDRSPAYAFNYESGAVALCRLSGGLAAARDLPCTNALTVDLANAADGTYTLSVSARDLAGNISPATTSTYVLDSTAPVAPKVVGPATPGANRAPVWKITATGPTECRLLRNATTYKDWAPCGSSYLADLFGQPDAVYALEVRLIGSTAATFSRYQLKTTGPAAPVLTAPPSPSTARRAVWSVASPEIQATAECRVLLFGAVFTDWAPCAVSTTGSLYALDLTGRGDGTYTLAARVIDAAKNVSPVATSDYVLDNSAPSAVGVTPPPSPGNDTTPTWTIVSVAGVKLECRVTSGQKLISDYLPCSTTFTADLSGLPDGTYTLTVRALSAAGTPGPETTSSYVLDTTAAAAPGTLTGPTGPSRNRAPTWTFVLAQGSTATCRVTSNGVVLRDGPCSSPYTMDLSSAPDGSYTLTVRAIDEAGNIGEAAVAGYVLRTVPAPTPSWNLVPGSPSSTVDPSWGFSVVRSVTAQCRRLLNGLVREDWTACTSPVTLSLVGQPDGKYTLQVRAIDVAGNTSSPISSDYVFDRTADPIVAFASTPPSPGNDLTPSWVIGGPSAPPAVRRASALAGTPTSQCRLTTPRGPGAWAPCSGGYTAVTTGDGAYVLEVRAVDSAGATGPVSASTYVLDTVQPERVRFTDEPPLVGNEAVASWSWNDDPLVTVECRVARPGQAATPFALCLSPQVITATSRGEGSYQLDVRPVDAAGNIGAVTTGTYRYDRTPPPAPVFVTRPSGRGTDPLPSWTFAVPVDTRATCVASHNGVVIADGFCNGSYTLDLRGQQPGDWTLSVRYTDTAGNVGPSVVDTYTLTAAFGRGGVSAPGGGFGTPGASPVGSSGLPLGGPAVSGGTTVAVPPASRIGEIVRSLDAAAEAVAKAVNRVPDVRIPGIPQGVGVPDAIKNVINSTITKPQLPLALFFVVLLFLLVQNRIDRRDPKLAAAPVAAEPDLAFGPRVLGTTQIRTSRQTGGATA